MTNTPVLQFLYAAYLGSIVIHALALLISIGTVIPLQIKEAQVKNGLAKLRKLMLASSVVIIFLSVISILVLSLRFFTVDLATAQAIAAVIVFTHGIGFLLFSGLQWKIYHQQYTPEIKEAHGKLEAVEIRQAAQKALEKLNPN